MADVLPDHVQQLVATDAQQQVEIDSLSDKHEANKVTAEKANVKADIATGWQAFFKTPLGVSVIALASGVVAALSLAVNNYIKDGKVSLPTMQVEITNWPAAPASIVARPVKLVVASTPATADKLAVVTDPVVTKALSDAGITLTYEPTHVNGSGWQWQGKTIPMPVAVLKDDKGGDLDVRPLTTAADLAAMLKR